MTQNCDGALTEQIRELAFGRANDAVKLILLEPEQIGVIDALDLRMVSEVKRGIGTVDVIVSAEDGIPSEELVTSVSTLLQAQREICVDIRVLTPTARPMNVSVEVESDGRYDFESLSAAVTNAIRGYFSGDLLGKSVTLAKLGSIIYAVPGVANYHIHAPLADLTAGESELPVLGTLTVTEA